MKKHQFSFPEDDIPMMEYGNMFLGNTMWLSSGKGMEEATFDLVVRDLPKNWGFLLMYGLDRFLAYIQSFHFSEEDTYVLKTLKLIEPEHEELYKNFKFSGDVWSIPEGTPFYAGEPIIRVSGPLWQVNLFTALALNAFSYPVRILTKGARVKIAAGKKRVAPGVNIVRSQGFEQVVICQKASYITGDASTTQPNFFKESKEFLHDKLFFQPNINHATIKSFNNEREAMRVAITKILPNSTALQIMVDTYNMKKGLKTLIEEIKKVEPKEQEKLNIPIDSGNVLKTANYMRKELDKNGLEKIGIMAYSNLDEYKIKKLEAQKAPIQYYICITEVVNVSDAPILEQVFKMSELIYPNGKIEYKAKLAKGKESYPGRKQIFRKFNAKGKMERDIIGLENEKLGEPLLKQYIKKGQRILEVAPLKETKIIVKEQIEKIPSELKKIYAKDKYKVEISKDLKKMYNEVKKKHL